MLVVYLATDNGGTAGVKHFNAGMRGSKGTVYRGSTRAPAFCRWTACGIPVAVECGALSNHIDNGPWNQEKYTRNKQLHLHAIEDDRKNVDELDDLEVDLRERTNLAQRFPERVAELHALTQSIEGQTSWRCQTATDEANNDSRSAFGEAELRKHSDRSLWFSVLPCR